MRRLFVRLFAFAAVLICSGCLTNGISGVPPRIRPLADYVQVYCVDPASQNYYTLSLPREYARCRGSDSKLSAAQYEARPRIGPQTAEAKAASTEPQRPAPRPAAPNGGSSGTGFVIAKSGLVLTNDHVVDDCITISVRPIGRPTVTGTVVARDPRNDLALLRVSAWSGAVASLRSGTSIRAGEGVVAYGFPYAGTLSSSGNVTTGSVTALVGLRDDSRYLQISAPVQPGNSGGPLLDMSGNVVGVVASKLNALRIAGLTGDIPQNVNFAIKSSIIQSFLDANDVRPLRAASNKDKSPADVAESARSFTVYIECR